ncbi:aromatic alcohol reductase [Granulicella tundricola]|uniref:NmrA family protein n=1 Tax=Granulicella tundricola (strain ATCC BAA-1859 / DSM 23138 / MP5ACTX9) TaxID=1198114 RepID=E8X339_GRATM|nr:aromatic alcohol reductase [Granulicella tundricola]ADW69263.1 NmrA family protein [Granulicella tundricola MP5ACTX9]
MNIAIAGATGALGTRITKSLIANGATVKALVRPGTDPSRLLPITKQGVEIAELNLDSPQELTRALQGTDCLISALLGLREVMVETQTTLLDAALKARVPRFIPSDYAMDFTRLTPGTNRNLDLHRDFQQRLDRSGIQATSILNGMFMDLLTGEAPFYLWKIRRVLCWGSPEQKMDFTTMDDTAAFTARAALDPTSPRWLKIAGDQRSARELAAIASNITGKPFKTLRPGGLPVLAAIINVARKLNSAPSEPFPAWQGMQYMHNMYEGKALMTDLANNRYPGMNWTTVQNLLTDFLQTRKV